MESSLSLIHLGTDNVPLSNLSPQSVRDGCSKKGERKCKVKPYEIRALAGSHLYGCKDMRADTLR